MLYLCQGECSLPKVDILDPFHCLFPLHQEEFSNENCNR